MNKQPKPNDNLVRAAQKLVNLANAVQRLPYNPTPVQMVELRHYADKAMRNWYAERRVMKQRARILRITAARDRQIYTMVVRDCFTIVSQAKKWDISPPRAGQIIRRMARDDSVDGHYLFELRAGYVEKYGVPR
jgi:hypothetical protein